MTSHLTVEKPETLSMLRQDAPQLQRALDDAGFKTGDSGLQFSLRDQSSSGQNNGNETGRNAQRLVISDEDTIPRRGRGTNAMAACSDRAAASTSESEETNMTAAAATAASPVVSGTTPLPTSSSSSPRGR